MKNKTQRKKDRDNGAGASAPAQGEAQWNCLVGLDAHSRQATLCITEWEFGSEPRVRKQLEVPLAELEKAYGRHVPADSLTVIEATSNAFTLARRLEAAGQRAAVVCSDTLSGFARSDRVNDRIDAHNLARAWARGAAREVHVPAEAEAERRELFFAYRDAGRGLQSAANRVWNYCHHHGLPLPELGSARMAEGVAGSAAERFAPGSATALRCEALLAEWRMYAGMKAKWLERIEAAVAADTGAARLMQAMSIGPVVAFALRAFIGDIARFATASQLVAYVGLNPSVSQSGESKGRGGMSKHGRRDLKWLMVEAAQNAMTFGKGAMHDWGRKLVKKGKSKKLALCALARKMLVQAWHILMGHPPLDPALSDNHRRKLAKVARSAQRTGTLAGLGYTTVNEYILDLSAKTASPARVRGEPPPGGSPPDRPHPNSTKKTNLQRK